MNNFRKSQSTLAAIMILAVICGLLFGILGEKNKPVSIKTPIERTIGLIGLFFVLMPMALYWIVPNTSWGKRRLFLGESAYGLSFYIGIVVGILGLGAVLIDPAMVIKAHLFELLLALFGLNYVFWAMVMKSRKTTDVAKLLDEKQIRNLADSAAVTLMLVTGIMIVMYFVAYHGVFIMEGMVWFLVYFFLSMIIFSCSNIVNFRRE
jgi:hypothetical protein